MEVNQINAAFRVSAQILPDTEGMTGTVGVEITQDLAGLALDSLFTQTFDDSHLAGASQVFDSFPNVELQATTAFGDDRLMLLMNSIHAIAIKCFPSNVGQEDEHITVVIESIGSEPSAPLTRQMVSGDVLLIQTEKGWPALATSAITLTGTAGMDFRVSIALVGHSTATATGYGS